MGRSCQFLRFSHSSHKVWSTISKLIGRSGYFSRLCPVSANCMVSQLVKNGGHKTSSRESTRLVNKRLSNLWKVPAPEENSLWAFQARGACCHSQEPEARKVSGSGFYLPGVYTPHRVGSQILEAHYTTPSRICLYVSERIRAHMQLSAKLSTSHATEGSQIRLC